MSKDSFVINRIKSLTFACKGLFLLIKTENSVITHLISTTLLTFIGWYFQLSNIEWMFQFFAIGLVISIEALNTAIEKIADYIHPDFDKKIGTIKDIGAGAVLFAAIFSFIILCFIYLPKLFLSFKF